MYFILITLATPLSVILISQVQADGLDDSNSILICSEEGFVRVAFEDLDGQSKQSDMKECCESACPLCQRVVLSDLQTNTEFSYSPHLIQQTQPNHLHDIDVAKYVFLRNAHIPRAPPVIS